MALSPHQYRSIIILQRDMVRVGWKPHIASQLISRAVNRILSREGGMGRIKFYTVTRPPGVQRPRAAGEQCVRMDLTPGQETRLHRDLDDYRARGWNVMMIEPVKHPGGREVWYACPPGQLPHYHQPLIFSAQAG